jgi:lytic cellulose monooxygenase (C1-hydroxylating)
MDGLSIRYLTMPSYLLRAEMIGLHEADVSYEKNPIRGAQFYPDCVQLEVTGDGTVELPKGVSFPGAYSYDDPGVVYDVRPSKAP